MTRTRAARGGVAATAAVALGAVLAGCGSVTTAGTGGTSVPPTLRLAGADGAAAGVAAGAVAPDVAGGALRSGPGTTGPGNGAGAAIPAGLPSGPGHARVRRLGQVGTGDVARLAAALGLHAAPVRADGGWSVRSGAATLQVSGADGAAWAYSRDGGGCVSLPTNPLTADLSAGTVSCAVGVPAPAAAPTATVVPGKAVKPPPVIPLLGLGMVRAAVLPVLRVEGVTASPDISTGGGLGWASADPTVAGLPTSGVGTSLTVDGRGVVYGSGWLAPAGAAGADYPLVTAAAAARALLRLPRPMLMCAEIAPEAVGATSPRAPLRCGGPLRVTGAVLGLSLRWARSGPLLVPSWLLSVAGSSAPLAVDAVDPRFLAQATPPPLGGGGRPSAVPGSGPGVGASGGGSVGGSSGGGGTGVSGGVTVSSASEAAPPSGG